MSKTFPTLKEYKIPPKNNEIKIETKTIEKVWNLKAFFVCLKFTTATKTKTSNDKIQIHKIFDNQSEVSTFNLYQGPNSSKILFNKIEKLKAPKNIEITKTDQIVYFLVKKYQREVFFTSPVFIFFIILFFNSDIFLFIIFYNFIIFFNKFFLSPT